MSARQPYETATAPAMTAAEAHGPENMTCSNTMNSGATTKHARMATVQAVRS